MTLAVRNYASRHRRTGSHGAEHILTPEIDWTSVPPQFWGRVSAVCRSYSECLDLNKWFGDEDFEPDLPVLLIVPDGNGFVYGQVCGMGLSPVYEIRDEAVARWEITEQRIRKTGSIVDFDSLREKAGLVERSKVDEAFRTALTDRIAKHKASPRTDPPRQPSFPNPKNQVRFPEMPEQTWKDRVKQGLKQAKWEEHPTQELTKGTPLEHKPPTPQETK